MLDFIFGFIAGGLIGAVAMACVAASHTEDYGDKDL